MQLKSLIRPLSRYNYFITQRFVALTHSPHTGGKPQQIPTSSLKRKEKNESSKSKLKMQGWQIHSYGDVDELLLTDKLKVPQLKQANECLVRVTTTTVNPIDVAMLSNNFNTL